MKHLGGMQRSPAAVPSVAIGDFVKYDGRVWIVASIEHPPMSQPFYWIIDQWGSPALWSANERSDGTFASPMMSARPGRLRGLLEKWAKKFQKARH